MLPKNRSHNSLVPVPNPGPLFFQGERDYTKLRGDTGPLVYPAGFVYLFSWLRDVTGEAVLPAQVGFYSLVTVREQSWGELFS